MTYAHPVRLESVTVDAAGAARLSLLVSSGRAGGGGLEAICSFAEAEVREGDKER